MDTESLADTALFAEMESMAPAKEDSFQGTKQWCVCLPSSYLVTASLSRSPKPSTVPQYFACVV